MTRIVLVVVALGAAVAGYLYWTSDERQIRRLLNNVAEAVSQEEESAGVTGLAEVAGLSRYLAPDVTLEPGEPFRPMTGAADVVSTVGRLRAIMATVQLEISDVEVEVARPLASVHATARLTLRDREGDERVESRDVLLALEKRDAGWVVTAARALRIFSPPR